MNFQKVNLVAPPSMAALAFRIEVASLAAVEGGATERGSDAGG